ncbi:DUF6531 domain-containing protein [Kineosporia succinea]|uniref:RHS repeat-associated protein n=1 Tax=Kineosporia succinea TaxID=84632 RepID=A0ABT9PF84_9ACTN|nr:DUF6531 domain-containing protein [Kineosporia succinea]MDP9830645.1 RHS repeat-associated protein [Kineosporia succinea]
MANWAVLDRSDPAPGDVEGTRALGRKLLNQAATVEQETARLRSLASSSGDLKMEGDYAAEYTSTLTQLPDDLSKLGTAYRGCGNALTRFAEELSGAQTKARQALTDGTDADARYRAAISDLRVLLPADQKGLADNGLSLSPATIDAATVQLDENTREQIRQAASRARTADSDLDRARTLADQAAALRGEAEDRAARGIDDSLENSGLKNKSWAEKAWDFVSAPFRSWDAFVDLCSAVALVAGVVALFISGPVGWALMAAALVAGAVVFGDSLVKYAKGEVGLGTVALNALGLIPGGRGVVSLTKFGRALGPLGRALTTPGGFRVLASSAGKGLRNVVTAFPHAIATAGGSVRAALSNPRLAARAFACRFLGRDPVDMVNGEMVMQVTDFELPGLLPMVLERTYASTYGVGRWFGPSWSSFLDQRLEVDTQGVCFAYSEAVLVSYPSLAPGESALPDEGPRMPLKRRGDGHYSVTDPGSGLTYWFAPPPEELGPVGVVLPLAAVSDRNGNRIDLGYDAVTGWLTEITHTGGYHVDVECQDGHITEFRLAGRDGADDVTMIRYGYDERGRLTDVINSSGLPMKFGYDRHNRMTSWTDRNGTWYRYTYDGAGRVIRTAGSAHCFDGEMRYDSENRVTVEVNSLGAETTYHYNEDGQVVRVVDPLGHVTTTTWDRYHRRTSETDPLGRTVRWVFDEKNQLVETSRPDGLSTRIEYGESGLPVRAIQPDGTEWRHTYDDRGNLRSTTDPLGGTTRYARTDRGALLSVTDALGRSTTVACDEAGLPTSFADPSGAVTMLARDSFGRVCSRTDPQGRVVEFEWSVEGRLVGFRAPDGARQTWRHDPEGSLVEQVDALGQTTTFEQTYFDLPSVQTAPDGARITRTYDTELRPVTLTDARGLVWRYEYDPAGRLVRETDFDGRVLQYRYDAAGQLLERSNGAGEVTRMHRDVLGQVVRQESAADDLTFAYDPAGRLVRAVNRAARVEFDRDVLGRVLAETINGRTVASVYDAGGRRSARRTPSAAESHWRYDDADRPVALTAGDQVLAFGYDQAGDEVTRTLGAGATLTQSWSPGGRLTGQEVRSGEHRLSRGFVRRGDGHVTRVEGPEGVRRYTLDPLGRITGLDAGERSERYAYDAAGHRTAARHPGSGDDSTWETTGTRVSRAGRFRYDYDRDGQLVRKRQALLSGGFRVWLFTWDDQRRMTGVTTPDGARWEYRYDALGRRISKHRLDADGRIAERVLFAWDGVELAEQVVERSARVEVTTWDSAPEQVRPLVQRQRSASDAQFFAIVTDPVGTPTELVDETGRVWPQEPAHVWAAAGPDSLCPLRFPGQYHDPESGLHYNLNRYYDPDSAAYVSSDPLGLGGGSAPYGYPANPLSSADPLGLVDGNYSALQAGSRGTVYFGEGTVRGFRNAGEVIERMGNLRNRMLGAGYEDVFTGIRGSSITNVSSKGTAFRWSPPEGGLKASDVDFLVVSPKMEGELDRMFAHFKNGERMEIDEMAKHLPKVAGLLEGFGRETISQLGRKADGMLIRSSLFDSLEPGSFIRFP